MFDIQPQMLNLYCLLSSFSPACYDGEVRLLNGTSAKEGRVEVCYGLRFHSVCDDFWDKQEAEVVCNQLNYNNSLGMEYIHQVTHRGIGIISCDINNVNVRIL